VYCSQFVARDANTIHTLIISRHALGSCPPIHAVQWNITASYRSIVSRFDCAFSASGPRSRRSRLASLWLSIHVTTHQCVTADRRLRPTSQFATTIFILYRQSIRHRYNRCSDGRAVYSRHYESRRQICTWQNDRRRMRTTIQSNRHSSEKPRS